MVEEEEVVVESADEVGVVISVIGVGVLLMLVEVSPSVDPSPQPGTRSGQLQAEIRGSKRRGGGQEAGAATQTPATREQEK